MWDSIVCGWFCECCIMAHWPRGNILSGHWLWFVRLQCWTILIFVFSVAFPQNFVFENWFLFCHLYLLKSDFHFGHFHSSVLTRSRKIVSFQRIYLANENNQFRTTTKKKQLIFQWLIITMRLRLYLNMWSRAIRLF